MTNKERYQHYTIDNATNTKQWYFPMELETSHYEPGTEEYESNKIYIDTLKNSTVTLSDGSVHKCEIGKTKLGYREFTALFVPVDNHDKYLELIRDELNRQAKMKMDGRCIIHSEKNGLKICGLQMPNPDYIEGTDMPKTIMIKCEGCPYEHMKQEHTVLPFTSIQSINEEGDVTSFEPENPVGYNSSIQYEYLVANFLEYVRVNKPKLTELAELLCQQYIQSEAVTILDSKKSTINGYTDDLKKLVNEFLDI